MKIVSLIAASAALAAMLGCSSGFQTTPTVSSAGVALGGRVHGGQQPVSGAQVYLYAAGTGGAGTASRSMLGGAGYVTTGADGSFSITGDYTCQPGDMVYLLAKGGNPGLAAGTNNTKLVLETALGACSALTPAMLFQVNEVTTVASVYALNAFQSGAGDLASGSSVQARQGLANAFAMVNVLVNVNTGVATPLVIGAATLVDQTKVNTLANVISNCVNSDGTGTPCSGLFSAAFSLRGGTPSDTLGVLISLANFPGTNPSGVFNQSVANAPFQPSLASAPNDWTVSVQFGSGQVPSFALAFDASGNAWTLAGGGSAVYELSPTGALLSPPGGFTGGGVFGAQDLAIDDTGNVWVANTGGPFGVPATNLAKLDHNGNPLSPATGFTGGGQSDTSYVAIDGTGAVWISKYRSVPIKFDNSGNVVPNITGAYSNPPAFGLAIDPNNNLWGATAFGAGIEKESPTGAPLAYTVADGQVNTILIAMDHAGDAWTANLNSISRISPDGTKQFQAGGFTGGGADNPIALAVDGGGLVWVASILASHKYDLASFSNGGSALSPSTGYQSPFFILPNCVAVDPSGNVWVGNQLSTPGVTVFVGAANATVTPFATGIKNGTLATVPQ